MKKDLFLLFVIIGIISYVLVGCSDTKVATVTETNKMCTESCHSESSDIGRALLYAKAGYDVSGHKNGPRFLDSHSEYTGHLYVQHGSNAPYTARSSCSKCHTHNGYVDNLTLGLSFNYDMVSSIGCFTCHAPHEDGNFGLRSTEPSTLLYEVVYDEGKGNLCVQCHQSRSTSASMTFTTPTKSLSSHAGPHHGPQGDMYMGNNHFPYDGKTYYGKAKHTNFLNDSCVTCHKYNGTSGNKSYQLGGHGFYLTADVHGTDSDPATVCVNSGCHAPDTSEFPGTLIFTNNKMATGDWDGDGQIESKTNEIAGLNDLLIEYFGDGTNNFGGNGKGGIVGHDGNDIASGIWGKDWEFKSAVMNQDQAQAYWNFKFFTEDKSRGIHNPTFAAQILYDSCVGLGLTVGTMRP